MPKRILSGTVVSDKNDQTVTVVVERRFTHPMTKKTVRSTKKYRAHDEKNVFKTGDQVRIQECPPRSKTKRWEVVIQAE
jgi:small subunit ribosomal protein S17